MTQDTSRTWPQKTVGFILGAICAYGAIRASFFFITDYALQTGWPDSHAYLLPLCIDALGAFAWLIYGLTRDKFALWVGVSAIATSMLFNAASHWFTTGQLEPTWPWITFGAFYPALSIGLGVELWSRWLNHAGTTPSRTTGTSTRKAGSSSASPSGTASKKAHSRTRAAAPRITGDADGATPAAGTGPYSTWTLQALKERTDEEIAAKARELGLTGDGTTPWTLVGPLRVNKKRAKKIHANLANGAGH